MTDTSRPLQYSRSSSWSFSPVANRNSTRLGPSRRRLQDGRTPVNQEGGEKEIVAHVFHRVLILTPPVREVRLGPFRLGVEDEAMDFPISELMDESACDAKLLSPLHPDGLRCPQCHASERIGAHRYRRREVPDHRCDGRGRVFNLFTGTRLHGTRRRPSAVLLRRRGIVQGTSTAQLARELRCSRTSLLPLRHRIQSWAEQALPEGALTDSVTEADEMFRNAGEKRPAAPRSRRSAEASRQQATRPRHLGQRPPAGGRRGR